MHDETPMPGLLTRRQAMALLTAFGVPTRWRRTRPRPIRARTAWWWTTPACGCWSSAAAPASACAARACTTTRRTSPCRSPAPSCQGGERQDQLRRVPARPRVLRAGRDARGRGDRRRRHADLHRGDQGQGLEAQHRLRVTSGAMFDHDIVLPSGGRGTRPTPLVVPERRTAPSQFAAPTLKSSARRGSFSQGSEDDERRSCDRSPLSSWRCGFLRCFQGWRAPTRPRFAAPRRRWSTPGTATTSRPGRPTSPRTPGTRKPTTASTSATRGASRPSTVFPTAIENSDLRVGDRAHEDPARRASSASR